MPRLSDSMEEGTILAWLLKDGAEVSAGDELVEIETDKATMVHESEHSGELKIIVGDGETVAVGTPIASIGAESATPDPPSGLSASAEAETAVRATSGGAPPAPRSAEGERLRVTPVARRIALEAGVRIDRVAGSGPAGRIRKRDVESAIQTNGSEPVPAPPGGADPPEPGLAVLAVDGAAASGPAKGDTTQLELSNVEQRIARRMSESKATVPDFAVEMEVECEQLVAFREKLGSVADPAPSVNDILIKATAIALRQHPRVNGSYRDGRLELHGRVNVGVAVASERGLFVPTVFDADTRGLAAIATRVREVASAVRDGSITASDLSGGTFTISNLGMLGVSRFTAVINPPQAAILAVGAMREKLKLEDGEVRAVRAMDLTLCCDHRVLDGAAGSRFLMTVKQLLEEPLAMAL